MKYLNLDFDGNFLEKIGYDNTSLYAQFDKNKNATKSSCKSLKSYNNYDNNCNYDIDDNGNCKLLHYKLTEFNSGEFEFSLLEDIKGENICICQKFETNHFSDGLMKLQLICDVLIKNEVNEIHYFVPFLPYLRQDRDCKNVSFGAKYVAKIMNNCHINKIITYDMHSDVFLKFFKGNLENRSVVPVFLELLKNKLNSKYDSVFGIKNRSFDVKKCVIIFPDFGAKKRFEKFFKKKEYRNNRALRNNKRCDCLMDANDVLYNAKQYNIDVTDSHRDAIDGRSNDCEYRFNVIAFDKTRQKNGDLHIEMPNNIFDMRDKNAIIIDDMIDSGKTAISVSRMLKYNNNVSKIIVYATHGIFSKNAIRKLQINNQIDSVIVSNSIVSNLTRQKNNLTKKLHHVDNDGVNNNQIQNSKFEIIDLF